MPQSYHFLKEELFKFSVPRDDLGKRNYLTLVSKKGLTYRQYLVIFVVNDLSVPSQE